MLLFYIVTKQIKALIVAVDKLRNSFVIEIRRLRSQPLSDARPEVIVVDQNAVSLASSSSSGTSENHSVLGRDCRVDVGKSPIWMSPTNPLINFGEKIVCHNARASTPLFIMHVGSAIFKPDTPFSHWTFIHYVVAIHFAQLPMNFYRFLLTKTVLRTALHNWRDLKLQRTF